MKDLAKILALSGFLLFSSPSFGTSGDLASDLFIPNKMHVKLVKDPHDYYALITFSHNGKPITIKDHIDTLWQGIFGYNGKFNFTKESTDSTSVFIPDKMHVELTGGGKDYRAEISFEHDRKNVTLDYRVKVQWQFLYNGEFDFTRD